MPKSDGPKYCCLVTVGVPRPSLLCPGNSSARASRLRSRSRWIVWQSHFRMIEWFHPTFAKRQTFTKCAA
jgi:hypothetical protein